MEFSFKLLKFNELLFSNILLLFSLVFNEINFISGFICGVLNIFSIFASFFLFSYYLLSILSLSEILFFVFDAAIKDFLFLISLLSFLSKGT